jgi:hypothetical protein
VEQIVLYCSNISCSLFERRPRLPRGQVKEGRKHTKSGPLSAEPHGSSLRPILLGPLHGDLCLRGTFQKPLSLRAFASVMPLHLRLFMKQAIERREHNLMSLASELVRSWDMFQRFLKPVVSDTRSRQLHIPWPTLHVPSHQSALFVPARLRPW